jgi:hypothetical protein
VAAKGVAMAGKGNPMRRFFPARAPLEGVEVNDSTWDEWKSVAGDPADALPRASTGDAAQKDDKPARGSAELPERRPTR